MSDVWKHFKKLNKNEAQCLLNKCKVIIKIVNYGTSSLKNHLLKHEVEILNQNKSPTNLSSAGSSNVSKTNNLSTFLIRESRPYLLSKCAAKDGFPISKIITSDACKAYLNSRQLQMPRSRDTVWEDIKKYHSQVFEIFKDFVSESKKTGNKFTILIDEWTDVSLRRYLNIKLHNGKKCMQFCLAPIVGKCDAFKLKEIVKKKLDEIDLNLSKDIVASVQDGASVMKKYGRFMPFESQFCLNHCLNLAILDVFYVKNDQPDDEENDFIESDEDINEIDDDQTIDDGLELEEPEPLIMEASYKFVITTVRKYIKIFRRSPVKLAQLKKNIFDSIGKELSLVLDCKIRWNSVLPMLERFNKLKSIIKSTMREYNYEYDDSIDNKIDEIIQCLRPVEESIKKLSSESCDLLIAEATCIYLLSSLQELQCEVSLKLFFSMKERIEERRNIEIISVLLFLHSGEYPKENEFFKYSSKAAIKKNIKDIYSRLFRANSIDDEEDTLSNENLSSNLNDTISKFLSTNIPRLSIDNDIKAFEGTKERTEKLEKIFLALKTIQATSTEVERTFSVAGNFKTKIRNRLSEQNLNILVYLKYHFLNKN